ncbi:MAG: hypothetical protein AAGL49_12610, partial [Pseudomonadota bacterium]
MMSIRSSHAKHSRTSPARLEGLRRRIAAIENRTPELTRPGARERAGASWRLGVSAIDERLPAHGLALNGLHEIAPAAPADRAPSIGFALALLAQLVGAGAKTQRRCVF